MWPAVVILILISTPFVLAANILIAQELVTWLEDRKLFQLCLVPILLCPIAGFAYASKVPPPLIGMLLLSGLPLVRLVLFWKVKTKLGYMLILLPSAIGCVVFVYSIANGMGSDLHWW